MPIPQLLVAILVVVADRSSKAAVAGRLASGKVVCLGRWMRIRHVVTRFQNRGLLRRPGALLAIWAAALIVVAFAARSGYFFRHSPAQMGIAAALAGAASNLYDRLRRGAVIDFLDLGWWPVFNLADVALVVGVILALRYL